MLNQSTIYRRHERRLARSYALKDDPRPAMIRVMSGLPLLSLVFPPFQPYQPQGVQHSEETSSAIDSTIFQSGHKLVFREEESVRLKVIDDKMTRISQVIFAGFIGGFVSQLLFGRTEQRGAVRTSGVKGGSSPFSHVSQAGGALATTLTSRPQQATTEVFGRLEIPWSRAVDGAASAGLLFGTKSFVSDQLDDSSLPSTLSFVLSSAMGGTAVATASLVRLRATVAFERCLHTAPSLYAREAMGAVLLFSSYETLKQIVGGSEDPTKFGDFAIAVSGALAGVLYRCVTTTTVIPSGTSGVIPLTRSIFPTLVRAAPAHAVLFWIYERVRRTTQPYNRDQPSSPRQH